MNPTDNATIEETDFAAIHDLLDTQGVRRTIDGRTMNVYDRLVCHFSRPSLSDFDPDWESHPGETLLDWWCEQQDESDEELDYEWLSKGSGLEGTEIRGVLDGRVEISDQIAEGLERLTGSPKAFWLNRERQYREALAKRST